mmetsp:Transcript_788/g.1686  ORF Transcript_788/g.1686 Transcript_788/m.1686 type:complete len:205 (+) Transcript_788:931-1545(+)|eukprot:617485-Prymnesium_polylepis.2
MPRPKFLNVASEDGAVGLVDAPVAGDKDDLLNAARPRHGDGERLLRAGSVDGRRASASQVREAGRPGSSLRWTRNQGRPRRWWRPRAKRTRPRSPLRWGAGRPRRWWRPRADRLTAPANGCLEADCTSAAQSQHRVEPTPVLIGARCQLVCRGHATRCRSAERHAGFDGGVRLFCRTERMQRPRRGVDVSVQRSGREPSPAAAA